MAYDFTKFKNRIKEVEEWLKKEFSNVRTGRAMPSILDVVKVDSYGSFMGISELATIALEDARCLRIVPWDKTQTKGIEKAITIANLGVSVIVDDKGLRVIFPELTGERRVEIAKIAKTKLEESKVTLRKYREEAIKEIQALKKNGVGEDDIKRYEKELQKFVDEGNKKLEAEFQKKEKEILS